MMDYLDFPLILVVLTFVSAVIWIADQLLWASSRRATVAKLRQRFPQWAVEGSSEHAAYADAVATQAKEPLAVEYARSFLPVLLVVLVLRSFLVEPFQIPSSSMVPTLEIGDFILVNKFAYGIRLPVVGTKVIDVGTPQRGDVMVFFPPHEKRYFIKRVIGLPGDRIEYRNKVLYINGEMADQRLLSRLYPPQLVMFEEQLGNVSHRIQKLSQGGMDRDYDVTVEPGHYFMMGDNRDNSADSRVWGQVPDANIVGKAFAIWMHWPTFFSIPSFSRVGLIN
jgi:signal peptidase I